MFVVAVEQNVPLAINMQVWATQRRSFMNGSAGCIPLQWSPGACHAMEPKFPVKFDSEVIEAVDGVVQVHHERT